MNDGVRRTGTIKLAVSLGWLAVAAAFGHLAMSSIHRGAPDLRSFIAVGTALALLLAVTTWSSQTGLVMAVSAAASVATMLVGVVLIALGLAHETGGLLLAGGASIAIVSIVSRSANRRLVAILDSDSS
jgi:hypothetical protein